MLEPVASFGIKIKLQRRITTDLERVNTQKLELFFSFKWKLFHFTLLFLNRNFVIFYRAVYAFKGSKYVPLQLLLCKQQAC